MPMTTKISRPLARAFVLSAVATASAALALSAGAATITITSRDAPGVGFNDPTPVAPVGGNTGTTLGEQRMKVYRHVADIWEAALTSNVNITVSAGWEALSCTATSAVLGSAGAWNIWHDFAGGQPGTWYPQALANKLAGVNLTNGIPDDGTGYGNVDIKTQFNINLGNTGCLDGTPFYLGLDGNAGAKVNFVTTLLHELGHGLGFSVLSVQTSTGMRILADGSAYADNGLPSIWEQFMYDNTAGKSWLNMTSLERKASAINPLQLAWTGPNSVAGATLLTALPIVKVASPGPVAAAPWDFQTASFGPAVSVGQKLGALVTLTSNAIACTAGGGISAADQPAVVGKVVIVDRGTCPFVEKVKNAQNAGAVGVLVANNAATGLPGMGGSDATVTIPSVGISQAAGTSLKAAVLAARPYGSRGKPGSVTVVLGQDPTRRAGADALGRPLLYTPNPLVGGSSVSHWDVSAFPNLLMEPNINSDLTTSLVPPKDLTVPLLKDLGW